MQPTYISIAQLFGSPTRHTVPLLQRPPGKLTALNSLSVELDNLAREVAKEQNAMYRLVEPTLSQSGSVIEKAYAG